MPWRRLTNSVRRRRKYVGGLLLTIVTLFAAALRWSASHEPLWLDELHTGWVVADGIDSIPRRAALGNQAPAYFYLPWLATRCCGLTPLGLRWPSYAAGVCLVLFAGWIAWRTGRSLVAAFLAATLVAIDADCVFYAVEARVYALIQCLTLIQVALLLRRLDDARWLYRLGWTTLGAILFYLHYTTALLLAAECVAILIVARVPRAATHSAETRMSSVRRWLAAHRGLFAEIGLMAAAATPAAWHLAAILARRANWTSFMAAPDFFELLDWRTLAIVPAVSLALLTLPRIAFGWTPIWRRHRRRDFLALALLAMLPLALAFGATHQFQTQLWSYRYLIAPATLGIVVAATGIALAPTRRGQALAAVAMLASAWPLSALHAWSTLPADERIERRELWQELLEHIEREDPNHRRPILLAAALVEDRELVLAEEDASPLDATRRAAVVEFCRFPLRSVWPVDRPDDQIIPLATREPASSLDESARRQLANAPGGWLVVRGNPRTATAIVRELTPRLAADQPGLRAASMRSFGSLTLVRW